jgi:hypothetical protein
MMPNRFFDKVNASLIQWKKVPYIKISATSLILIVGLAPGHPDQWVRFFLGMLQVVRLDQFTTMSGPLWSEARS